MFFFSSSNVSMKNRISEGKDSRNRADVVCAQHKVNVEDHLSDGQSEWFESIHIYGLHFQSR